VGLPKSQGRPDDDQILILENGTGVNGTYPSAVLKAVKFLGYDYKPVAMPRNLACK
jgi:hypothetical protein